MEKYLLEILVGAFGFVLTSLATVIIMYFKDIKTNLQTMSKSMVEMNIELKSVITDQSWHKEEIKEIKDDIKNIYGRLNAQNN